MKPDQRKRKMMLVLPLLVIPFLTLAFYAMGGGSGSKAVDVTNVSEGLNPKLPDANLKEENLMDKLGFYDKAAKDSAKMAEWMRSDPYYKERLLAEETASNELEQLTQTTASRHNQRLNLSPYEQTRRKPEDEVLQKLSLLQKELNNNTTANRSKEPGDYTSYRSNPELGTDMDRLEAMMNMMSTGHEEDPEIKQLSSVMDKILDVQHPGRVRERLAEQSKKKEVHVMAVTHTPAGDTAVNGFYSLDSDAPAISSNAIEAVVNENQVLVNGAVIKLRLLQDIYVSDQKVPAGTFVFGIVGLNGERLEIEINSIRSGSSLFPVKMEVHDMDGLAGIHIPGAITRDVAKQSADNSLQMMELTTLDPSLKAQATTAGINTAKNLLSRKAKQVKVMVKAGYKVLLWDKSAKQ